MNTVDENKTQGTPEAAAPPHLTLLPETYRPGRLSDEEVAAYYGKRVPFKEMVYDLINGALDLEEYPTAASEYIVDEFREGSECERLYDEMWKAKLCVFKRLGYEDEDLDVMVNRCFDICRILCMRMYDYGARFGK